MTEETTPSENNADSDSTPEAESVQELLHRVRETEQRVRDPTVEVDAERIKQHGDAIENLIGDDEGFGSDSDLVDIPCMVPKDTARKILTDLEETGSVTLDVSRDKTPKLLDQIQWQLDHGQQILRLVDVYNPDEYDRDA